MTKIKADVTEAKVSRMTFVSSRASEGTLESVVLSKEFTGQEIKEESEEKTKRKCFNQKIMEKVLRKKQFSKGKKD